MIVNLVIYMIAGVFIGMHINTTMDVLGPFVGMVIVYLAFMVGIFFHFKILY